MRSCRSIVWKSLVAAAVLLPCLTAQGQEPLEVKDIALLRREHVPHQQIVEKATERGVAFEVTTGVRAQLRRLGFKAEQIDAIQAAHAAGPPEGRAAKSDDSRDLEKPEKGAPLVPGQGLRTTDAQRDRTQEKIQKITKASGVDIQSRPCQHVTLWAPKEALAAYQADVKRLEQFLQTKCEEPLRSGLDKRSTHVILIGRRYEYEKWIHAMFDLIGDRFRQPSNPGGDAELKNSFLKAPAFVTSNFAVFCMEGRQTDWLRRSAAASIGYMYLTQLAELRQSGPLATGFANGLESAVAPSN